MFILIPIGVLFHEIGHSLATWQVGGTVETFQWRLFWGFIIPSGDFSPVESWWISFSGNLVSILLGLLPIPFILQIRRRIISEIVYSFACIQSIYALIYYPVFSFATGGGDWLKIYDFSIQPLASLTLLLHIGLVWGLWTAHGSQVALRWRLARTPDTSKTWQGLKAEVAQNPKDLQSHLKLGYFLLQHDEGRAARRVARKMEKIAPENVQVKVFRVAVLYGKKAYKKAIRVGKLLLEVRLPPHDHLRLYRILCLALSSINRFSEALSYANQGLAYAPHDWQLRYDRAIVHHKLRQNQEAVSDLEIAIEYAPDEQIRQQLQTRLHQMSGSEDQRSV